MLSSFKITWFCLRSKTIYQTSSSLNASDIRMCCGAHRKEGERATQNRESKIQRTGKCSDRRISLESKPEWK